MKGGAETTWAASPISCAATTTAEEHATTREENIPSTFVACAGAVCEETGIGQVGDGGIRRQ